MVRLITIPPFFLLVALLYNRSEVIFPIGEINKPYSDTSNLRKLNINFMNRGYFYAYSSFNKNGQDESNGWAVADNRPHPIKNHSFIPNALTVKIDTKRIDTFKRSFQGFPVFIANTTADTIAFNAQDSRLNMILQARNEKGSWQNIEYLPNSSCGNSYHLVRLQPGTYWKFTMPDYEGQLKTKIRIILLYSKKDDLRIQAPVFSNEIDGSVNPGQFVNKPEYQPMGLMDPYNN